jgi:transcriptional regulator with XRE-family HTH domain
MRINARMNALAPRREELPGPRKLRSLKKRRGITQHVIARTIGVGQGTISRYASGAMVPSLGHFVLLRDYCRGFSVSLKPEDFLGAADPTTGD